MKLIIGIIIGGVIGFVISYISKCLSGECSFIGNPVVCSIVGAIFGAMVTMGRAKSASDKKEE